jgi:hypothetical protein
MEIERNLSDVMMHVTLNTFSAFLMAHFNYQAASLLRLFECFSLGGCDRQHHRRHRRRVWNEKGRTYEFFPISIQRFYLTVRLFNTLSASRNISSSRFHPNVISGPSFFTFDSKEAFRLLTTNSHEKLRKKASRIDRQK